MNTLDKKRIRVLLAGIQGAQVPFKMDKGISLLESTGSDILKVYGQPTATVKVDNERKESNLLYDTIGLGFWVHDA